MKAVIKCFKDHKTVAFPIQIKDELNLPYKPVEMTISNEIDISNSVIDQINHAINKKQKVMDKAKTNMNLETAIKSESYIQAMETCKKIIKDSTNNTH